MSNTKKPLVYIDRDGYGDTLCICKNGFQSTGISINKEIATKAIQELNNYLNEEENA